MSNWSLTKKTFLALLMRPSVVYAAAAASSQIQTMQYYDHTIRNTHSFLLCATRTESVRLFPKDLCTNKMEKEKLRYGCVRVATDLC
ncbi:hypothetical protein PPTG_24484 [Phytophthora nicotianae INRA-310]|uniref:RxLR effector protein n=1 Tax=Phytophthora nicotianae (strain INRA-310) TaxID=761204 RepID=W2PDJ4_PHYN3|nr:hypothetical protein PPTG_24484 [Phytophthora nicotianae INRA-310]ETM99122.1 hypothetical protein PPTG_24484 [Phytophthora nicotianae INRA-310]